MDVTSMYIENQALIHHIIRKHYPHLRGTSQYEDAFQNGSIGLLKAIKGFKSDKGCEFSTYAYPAIRSEIYKGLYKNNSNLNVSRYASSIHMSYKSLVEDGYSFDEIVDELNTTPATLLDTINAFDSNDYLEREIASNPDGSSLKVRDLIKYDFNTEDYFEFNTTLNSAKILCNIFLSEEDNIMLGNYYNGIAQAEIGEKVGKNQVSVSRRITRIENTLFPIFRRYLEGDIEFGKLCLMFIEKDRKTRLVLKCYLDCIFGLTNHPNEFVRDLNLALLGWDITTFSKVKEFLSDDRHYLYQIKDELTSLVKVVDKYYSTEGIEVTVFKRLSSVHKIKNIDEMLNQVS